MEEATPESNPIVKIRLGNMEAVTDASIYGGQEPMYHKQIFEFPLGEVNLQKQNVFKIVVANKSITSSVERIFGEFKDDGDPVCKKGDKEDEWAQFRKPGMLRQWIANGRYEGPIPLENDMGTVSVVMKTNFMSQLQLYDDDDSKITPELWKSIKARSHDLDDDLNEEEQNIRYGQIAPETNRPSHQESNLGALVGAFSFMGPCMSTPTVT